MTDYAEPRDPQSGPKAAPWKRKEEKKKRPERIRRGQIPRPGCGLPILHRYVHERDRIHYIRGCVNPRQRRIESAGIVIGEGTGIATRVRIMCFPVLWKSLVHSISLPLHGYIYIYLSFLLILQIIHFSAVVQLENYRDIDVEEILFSMFVCFFLWMRKGPGE